MIRSLSNVQLIDLWERAAHQWPARRSLSLLAAFSDSPASAEQLPAGERDRRLLRIREQLFGERIEAVTECPGCTARIEFVCSAADLAHGTPAASPQNPLVCEGYELQWRLPTSADLAEAAVERLPERIGQRLLDRCLLEVRREQQLIAADDCPPAVMQELSRAMAEADPYGDIRLELTCPDCGAQWQSTFDIGAFLWSELDAWARQLLWDIHCLASRYGWSETEIMALPAERRKLYLELLDS